MVPWVGLLCVIVVFPDNTHFLFFLNSLVKYADINRRESMNDFCIYRTSEQRRLMRVCVYVHACLSIRCSHTQGMNVDEGSYNILDP